jgi:hypothetical protein
MKSSGTTSKMHTATPTHLELYALRQPLEGGEGAHAHRVAAALFYPAGRCAHKYIITGPSPSEKPSNACGATVAAGMVVTAECGGSALGP